MCTGGEEEEERENKYGKMLRIEESIGEGDVGVLSSVLTTFL